MTDMTAVAPAAPRAATESTSASLATIELPVEGMTCASCQARVQKALGKQPGVADATVNLLMNNATVTYDPLVTGPDAFIAAVRKTGYDAAIPRPTRSLSARRRRTGKRLAASSPYWIPLGSRSSSRPSSSRSVPSDNVSWG